MRYLAIDYGQKRTGLAVCDNDETIASPLTVIQGQGQLVPHVIKIIQREQIEAVVIGLPLNMDDTEGPQAKRIRDFAEKLSKDITVPIHFHDERLSSFDAEKKLSGLGMTRQHKKKRIDAIAAAAILQAFLDHKHTR